MEEPGFSPGLPSFCGMRRRPPLWKRRPADSAVRHDREAPGFFWGGRRRGARRERSFLSDLGAADGLSHHGFRLEAIVDGDLGFGARRRGAVVGAQAQPHPCAAKVRRPAASQNRFSR